MEAHQSMSENTNSDTHKKQNKTKHNIFKHGNLWCYFPIKKNRSQQKLNKDLSGPYLNNVSEMNIVCVKL